jgi:hypothetical protein
VVESRRRVKKFFQDGKGTPESGKIRLAQSRKIAKEKNENSMLCEGSYDPLKDAVEGR